MITENRKILFKEVRPLINQGINADKMTQEQIEKMVMYADKIKTEHEMNSMVVNLVDSILACFDDKEQMING